MTEDASEDLPKDQSEDLSKERPEHADSAELEQYRWLLDHIPAEIGIFDPEGRFLFNTPSGVHDPEVRAWMIGKTHHDFCRERDYPMEMADRRQSVIERCVSEKRSVTFEEILEDREGRRLHYVRTFTPVLDDGVVSHVIGYGHEITELKQTEEELRLAHADLEAEVLVRREAESDLRRALAALEELRDRLRAQNEYLREEIGGQHNFGEIVGESPAIKAVLQAVETVAPTEANVLIVGETGTGKELVARAVHKLSDRSDRPLIKVNCAAVPRELFESEFFGHVKGAFTGALRDREGRFRLADRGTLFLDEVGEIPLEMQAKLLRVLQDGEFERVGDERTRRVDVRVIAATNRDLRADAAEGRFRMDLYYRLAVFPIEVGPLRDRQGDIALLAGHFLSQAAGLVGGRVRALQRDDLRRLERYEWPGNVRELRNVIERAVIRARGGPLSIDLPASRELSAGPQIDGSADGGDSDAFVVLTEIEMKELERTNTQAALRLTNGRVYGPEGAAALLGVNPNTLASRIKRMGISARGPCLDGSAATT